MHDLGFRSETSMQDNMADFRVVSWPLEHVRR